MPESSTASAPEVKRIFISHIALDAHYALLLTKEIEKAFSGKVTAFVSATGGRLGAFTDAIEEELRSAEILMVLVSRFSVSSTWVSFEAGFARALGRIIFPVFNPPVTASQLPPSLSQLEARRLNAQTFPKQIIKEDLARALGLRVRPGFQYKRMHTAIRAARSRETLMTNLITELAKEEGSTPPPPNSATTVESLAKRVGISENTAVEVLDYLESSTYVASSPHSRKNAYSLTKRSKSILA